MAKGDNPFIQVTLISFCFVCLFFSKMHLYSCLVSNLQSTETCQSQSSAHTQMFCCCVQPFRTKKGCLLHNMNDGARLTHIDTRQMGTTRAEQMSIWNQYLCLTHNWRSMKEGTATHPDVCLLSSILFYWTVFLFIVCVLTLCFRFYTKSFLMAFVFKTTEQSFRFSL